MGDMERDHSMEKLGRILDGKGSIRTDSLQTPTVRKVQDHSRENSRAGSRKHSDVDLKPDPVAMMKLLKEQEEQEAAEKARKEAEERRPCLPTTAPWSELSPAVDVSISLCSRPEELTSSIRPRGTPGPRFVVWP